MDFVDNQDCLDLLEGAAAAPAMGVFPLIDEACRIPRATHQVRQPEPSRCFLICRAWSWWQPCQQSIAVAEEAGRLPRRHAWPTEAHIKTTGQASQRHLSDAAS